VWARNGGSAALYDAYSSVVSFSTTGAGTAPLLVTGLQASVPLPAPVGVPMTWTATATGGTAPVQYEFWIELSGTGWVLVQGYDTSNTLLWTPGTAGVYRIQVWARNGGSAALYDAYSSVVTFTITSGSSLDGS